MNCRGGLVGVVLAFGLVGVASGGPVIVKGQVVYADQRRAVGVEVARFWHCEEAGWIEPTDPIKADDLGGFSLEVDLLGRDAVAMAMDAKREFGGFAIVRSRKPDLPLLIELLPLIEVRGRFTCSEAGKFTGRTSLSISLLPDDLWFVDCRSRGPEFTLKLPPGRYRFTGGGRPIDYLSVGQDVTLKPTENLDIGSLDQKLTLIARHYNRTCPAWNVTDSRGIGKDVQISDFKGKWVVIDFWGYWCAPCVGRSLPGWIDFCEDHVADRERFEVLAFHDAQAKDFNQLDQKMFPIVRTLWRGRHLPFPILLDSTGRTIKNFGVSYFPTALLVDPDGHLVKIPDGELVEDYLASKLPSLPQSVRIARALDRDLGLAVTPTTLAAQLKFLSLVGRVKLLYDADELRDAGVDPNAALPFRVNARLTLRAWLNFSLEPFRLTYVPDKDGLRIVRRTALNSGLSQPSARQMSDNARVEGALRASVRFDFHREPLKNVVAFFQMKTKESFVLSPSALKAGTLNAEALVDCADDDQPVSVALKRLLEALGLSYAVRDEAVVIACPN